MTPKWKPDGQPTYHRDGSVSYWDVFLQQWQRRPAQEISDSVQASHDDVFRRRVGNMTAQHHRRCAERARPVPGVKDRDGAIACRGEDPDTGRRYWFVYRAGGAAFAEVWHEHSEEEDGYIWRALPTPLRMIDHVCEAILARRSR